jgi:hypothetical protein
MSIWMVIRVVDCDGYSNLAAFSTKEKAELFLSKLAKADKIYVHGDFNDEVCQYLIIEECPMDPEFSASFSECGYTT